MTRPITPILRTRATAVAVAATTASALALLPVPLYNRLGFEFAVAMGIVLLILSGWNAAGVAAAARRAAGDANDPAAPFPGRALLAVAIANSLLLVPPLLVQALRSAFDPPCDLAAGLRFYAVFTIPSLAYGTGFGFACGLAARRGRTTFFLWVALVVAAGAAWILAHPPKFTYNPIIGFFPGPLYDTLVPLDRTLLLARTGVVLQALSAIAVAALAWDGRGLSLTRLGRDLRGERAVLVVLATPLVIAVVLLQVFAAPLGIRIDRGFIQKTLGGHLATEHVDLYYDRATLSPERAAAFAAQHEVRWQQLHAFFAGTPPPPRIGSYVYGSATQKKRLMGAGATSFEDALHDEFHINLSSEDPHPVLTHEMAHIFAAQIDRWRPVCWKMGIHEGIAVAAEWMEESARLEMTPHEACAAMDSLGLLPPIEGSMSAFGFWTQPGARAYTACGSFIRFLVETRGMARFRELWQHDGDFTRAYGEPLPRLVAVWRDSLATLRPTPEQLRRAERLFGGGSIFTVRCAHEVAAWEREASERSARGDARGAEAAWAQVVGLDPADTSARIEWARARLASGDAAGCLAALDSLLAKPGPLRGRDRALRLAVDATWSLGRIAAAESLCAHGRTTASGNAELRAFEVTGAVLADPRLAPILRPALAEVGADEATAAAALALGATQAPDSPWPHYLLGRRLFFADEWRAAASELETALAAGLTPQAAIAARELVLRAALEADPATAAAKAAGFEALAQDPRLPMWRRLSFADRALRSGAQAAGLHPD